MGRPLNSMNQTVQRIILILLLIFSAVILPVFMGINMMELPEEDDLTDSDENQHDVSLISNSTISWIRIPVHQLVVLLKVGISIFALLVIYIGGRSKDKRFNDRTIDPINILIDGFLRTALLRAVFNFLFRIGPPYHVHDRSIDVFYPTLIPNRRSTKL
jgi:hypothetical protein